LEISRRFSIETAALDAGEKSGQKAVFSKVRLIGLTACAHRVFMPAHNNKKNVNKKGAMLSQNCNFGELS
jgi:hypothetical protein